MISTMEINGLTIKGVENKKTGAGPFPLPQSIMDVFAKHAPALTRLGITEVSCLSNGRSLLFAAFPAEGTRYNLITRDEAINAFKSMAFSFGDNSYAGCTGGGTRSVGWLTYPVAFTLNQQ